MTFVFCVCCSFVLVLREEKILLLSFPRLYMKIISLSSSLRIFTAINIECRANKHKQEREEKCKGLFERLCPVVIVEDNKNTYKKVRSFIKASFHLDLRSKK